MDNEAEQHAAVTAILLDTVDLVTAEQFWTTMLGLAVVHREHPYVYLGRISPDGPYLALQQVPEHRTGKNRLHFDIRVPDRAVAAVQVVAMGGSVLGEHQEGDFPAWTIVCDPEGNEFCIYEPSPTAASG